MNWLQYAKRQDSTANAAMWQLCRAAYRWLESEDGSAAEMAQALNLKPDSVYSYADAYGLWLALYMEDRRNAETSRHELRFSHFVKMARAARNYKLTLAQCQKELTDAAKMALSVRDFDDELKATYAEHYVAPWAERSRYVVSYFQDLLACPEAPDDFKRDLAQLLNHYFFQEVTP